MPITGVVLLVLGMLAAFMAGAYITYKVQRNQLPIPKFSSIIEGVIDDLPDPVSPYEEAKKVRRG